MRLTTISVFCFAGYIYGKILRLPCGKFDASFIQMFRSQRLTSNSAVSVKAASLRECISACIKFSECQSININKDSSVCELLDATSKNNKVSLLNDSAWLHVETEENPINLGPLCVMEEPCKNGARCVDICEPPGFKCTCPVSLRRVRELDCAYDIAMSKAADQSSTFRGHHGKLEFAWMAVDGDKSTLSKTKDSDDEWWRLDFGEIMEFDEIIVKLANQDGARAYMENNRVLISNASDFENPTLCHRFTKNLPLIYSFKCMESPSTAKYLKVSLTRTGSIVLWDVLVYGWHL